MRILLLLFMFTAIAFASNSALADEFGDRFYNQAPSGLGDYTAPDDEFPDIAMDDIAKSLQNIMPAAGNEEKEEDTSFEDTIEEVPAE